jgi:DNA-binding NtrC family response regulator
MAHILCVDDEPHVTTLYIAILEVAGHNAFASLSAHDAVAKLESNAYDLVITGWNLGDAKGNVVIEAAKRKKTPVIVISGYVHEARELANPQADLYLEKPADPDMMMTEVNRLLMGLSSLA